MKTLNADTLIVDTRPFEERYDPKGLGFIPSSFSIPSPSPEQLLDLVGEHTPHVVIYCLSGRRSGAILETLPPEAREHVSHLEGGLLAWSAAGLPIVAPQDDMEREVDTPYDFDSIDESVQLITSCYVGTVTETLLDHDNESVNPREIIESCFAAEDIHAPSDLTVRSLLRVLDRAAWTSRQLGTDIAQIGQNLSAFLVHLWSRPEFKLVS